MIVAYACIRTSIMYKCSKFVFCARNAQNVESQQNTNKKETIANKFTTSYAIGTQIHDKN